MSNNNNNNHVLLPIDPDSNRILSLRPSLIIDFAVIHLGGNDDTEILDPRLQEKIVKVYKNNNTGKIYAFVPQSGGRDVHLGDDPLPRGTRRQLHEGDVIAIYNDDGIEYKYLFVREDHIFNTNHHHAANAAAPGSSPNAISNGSNAAAAASEPTTTAAKGEGKTSAVEAPFPPQLAENITCAVCMEILLYPRTMVPCGHSFCKVSAVAVIRSFTLDSNLH